MLARQKLTFSLFPRLAAVSTAGLLAGLLASPMAPEAQAGPPEPVDVAACVAYSESDVARDAFDIRLASTCERSLRCKVEWTLSCSPDSRPEAHSKSFTLRPNSTGKTRISAQHCKGDDWEVDALNWWCDEK